MHSEGFSSFFANHQIELIPILNTVDTCEKQFSLLTEPN